MRCQKPYAFFTKQIKLPKIQAPEPQNIQEQSKKEVKKTK